MGVSIQKGEKVTITLKKGKTYSIRGLVFIYAKPKEAPQNIAEYLLKHHPDKFAKGKWTPPVVKNTNAGDMSSDDLKNLHEEVFGGAPDGDDDSNTVKV